jgi:hypothetical protein
MSIRPNIAEAASGRDGHAIHEPHITADTVCGARRCVLMFQRRRSRHLHDDCE